jgi:HEAT repeat protein
MREQNHRTPIAKSGSRSQTLVAAAAVGALGKDLSIPEGMKVVGLLKCRDPKVREEAVNTLARYGGRQYISYITRALRDSDIKVRIEACNALGQLRAHPAKKDLYDAVMDRNAYVRCAAASALARMGDKYGLPYIARLVCISGQHQATAIQAYNLISGRHFRPGPQGVAEAVKWIRTNHRDFFQ